MCGWSKDDFDFLIFFRILFLRKKYPMQLLKLKNHIIKPFSHPHTTKLKVVFKLNSKCQNRDVQFTLGLFFFF